jgi:zinc protease
MMQNALPNQHPDAIAIRIANVVFSHVLNAQLREKYSVTYGCFPTSSMPEVPQAG